MMPLRHAMIALFALPSACATGDASEGGTPFRAVGDAPVPEDAGAPARSPTFPSSPLPTSAPGPVDAASDAGAPPAPRDASDEVGAPIVDAAPVPEPVPPPLPDPVPVPVPSPSPSPAPAGPSGLLYSFPFDGDLRDVAGGNDGAGAAVAFVADRNGALARAVRFDGVASWISASGARLPVGAAARTMTAWVKPASAPAAGVYANAFISWGTGDCLAQMFGIGDIADRALVWTGCNDAQTTLPLAPGRWVFVAVRFAPPNAVRVWVGRASADVTLSFTPNTAASLLWIGAETTTNVASGLRRYFAGDLDSLRIYGRALDDGEVEAVSALP